MFGHLFNGQALQALKDEVRQYLELQRSELQLVFIIKLTLLLSALSVAIVLFAIGIIAAVYASFALTAWLEQLTGSTIIANLIMAGVFMTIALIVYILRKRLIERPIASLLTRLFYTKDHYDTKS